MIHFPIEVKGALIFLIRSCNVFSWPPDQWLQLHIIEVYYDPNPTLAIGLH